MGRDPFHDLGDLSSILKDPAPPQTNGQQDAEVKNQADTVEPEPIKPRLTPNSASNQPETIETPQSYKGRWSVFAFFILLSLSLILLTTILLYNSRPENTVQARQQISILTPLPQATPQEPALAVLPPTSTPVLAALNPPHPTPQWSRYRLGSSPP